MKQVFVFVSFGWLTLVGCTSSSNPVADMSSSQKKVAWIGVVFRNPITNTADPNAVATSGLIASMNAQAAAPWLRPFDTIAAVSFKNIDQWTLVIDRLTETLTRTTVGDSVFGGMLKFNGVGTTGSYTNTLAYEDSNRVDGTYGSWAEFYLPLSPNVKPHEFSYMVDAKGTRMGKDILAATGPQIDIADSANGSGVIVKSTLVAGTLFVITFKAQWLLDGSGQWTAYDIAGKLTGTGIWGK